MRFTRPINIWSLTPEQMAERLQPGQWVYAGEPGNTGRYLGARPSGTVVVAWSGNVNSQSDRAGYLRALRTYAKGQ